MGGRPHSDARVEAFEDWVMAIRAPATRGPFMHDARSADLHAAVVDMVFETRPDLTVPPDEELRDVVAYLESL